MYCDECGKQIKKEASVCPYCHSALKKTEIKYKTYYLYSGISLRMRLLSIFPLFILPFSIAVCLSFISLILGIISFVVLSTITAAVFSSYIGDYIEIANEDTLVLVRKYGTEKKLINTSDVDLVKYIPDNSDLWFHKIIRSYALLKAYNKDGYELFSVEYSEAFIKLFRALNINVQL